ncbi:MAG: TetM/TetW/TetO/TetS family tetracycline resistance ribosomal protection protein [Lachnospiraceae bacterium]|nr:TetM/TetW/TetO/TetS family tetracycline resistance ribosomal protection protein [Lachnospiraceae bacterium]
METAPEYREKHHICVGLLAHVDAGKTTLAENILYRCGVIDRQGRVDHADTYLDTHAMERERGITIFSKQARVSLGEYFVTLLDTPGHVDFSTEMERTLRVLDYAVLVINGAEGIQSHTVTLWRLLAEYGIPVFIFINQMDRALRTEKELMELLREKLDEGCLSFSADTGEEWYEELALKEEGLLEQYLAGSMPESWQIAGLIKKRLVFPCYFGSALKDFGVEKLLYGLRHYMVSGEYSGEFSARVFKIGRDEKNNRLTYVKITGGSLRVKQVVEIHIPGKDPVCEKVDQIRLYSGRQFHVSEEVGPGMICALTGLTETVCGAGLGGEGGETGSSLVPVMTYRLLLPEGVSPYQTFLRLKQLEEEDPLLSPEWVEAAESIHMKVMGSIQTEILGQMIRDRFGLAVEFDRGHVIYKETIESTVEGMGHYEPLRHYAEVHLLLEPLPSGSGLQIASACSEDVLERNWQRLILTHIGERAHKGVLIGGEITDLRITLLTGRAHPKHTEGGDFRQATYRAIRQGLRKAVSRLLEPVYEFVLEIPTHCVGRAMTDIRQMHGDCEAPVTEGEYTRLAGICPVSSMGEYQTVVQSYTKGLGRLECRPGGYRPCHNEAEVVALSEYDPDQDTMHPSGSVFCFHGAGMYVDWKEADSYMHLPAVWQAGEDREREQKETACERDVGKRQGSFAGSLGEDGTKSIATEEIDAILQRTFYANRKAVPVAHKGIPASRQRRKDTAALGEEGSSVKRIYRAPLRKEPYLLVDGYNIMFAWQELKELAQINPDSARDSLLDLLCNYQAMKGCQIIAVFDAYRRKGHPVEWLDYHNIHVVYTKEAETADQYIERFAHEHGKTYEITVATSDGLEQMIIRGEGCLLLSAQGLKEEILRTAEEFRAQYLSEPEKKDNFLGKYFPEGESNDEHTPESSVTYDAPPAVYGENEGDAGGGIP